MTFGAVQYDLPAWTLGVLSSSGSNPYAFCGDNTYLQNYTANPFSPQLFVYNSQAVNNDFYTKLLEYKPDTSYINFLNLLYNSSNISPSSVNNNNNNNFVYTSETYLTPYISLQTANVSGLNKSSKSKRVTSSKSKTTNQYITEYKSSSKIKPGLLKGNLAGKEDVITKLCEKYGVDVALVVSIIGQESGFGTSNLAKHNNFMGYRAAGDCGKSKNGFGYFSTPEKGLEAAIKNLASYPKRYASVKKADMNNIDAIGRIYCEGGAYSSSIKNIYNKTVKGYLA